MKKQCASSDEEGFSEECGISPYERPEISESEGDSISPVGVCPEDPNDFCQIAIEDFVSGKSVNYSIFARVGVKSRGYRFVKIAHTGQDISLDRIKNYRQKGLKYLYIRTEDFRSYVGLLERLTSAAQVAMPRAKVAKLVNHTISQVEQELMKLPISEESIEHANYVVASTVKLVTSEQVGLDLLDSLICCSDQLYDHTVMVTGLSSLIAKEMKWDSSGILMKIATAALFHDIGKRQLPPELLKKSRSDMSSSELIEYEKHPLRGHEILTEQTHYPEEVIQAVLHHHERPNGIGFPNHLNAQKIIPIANVLATADEFAHAMERFAGQGSAEVIFKKAMDFFMKTRAEFLNRQTVDALKKVFSSAGVQAA